MTFHTSFIDNDVYVHALEHGSMDPHRFLGIHSDPSDANKKVIRVWRPGAEFLKIELQGKAVEMERVHPAGLFELVVVPSVQSHDYKVWHISGLLAEDPYTFWPTFGEMDAFLFNKGVHYKLYDAMGGRLHTQDGVAGAKFAVWAPGARRVSLVGDFNHWDGRVNPMRPLGSSGVWEIFVPGLKAGEKYKFEIRDQQGSIFLKSDPYALYTQLRPETGSVLADVHSFLWEDYDWLERRLKNRNTDKPMVIYEVHLGSWKLENGNFKGYRQLAVELAEYCNYMGFTHIELMPISEHPLDESWGYQVTGYYSVTSRFGTPEDFQWFVNHLHQHNIGVILDWVPGHFPTDDFSLRQFDGTALYEHADPRQGFHPHWSTCIFNFGRHEVSNFLIANALYWCEVMHIDGLRVDAVASMLYLDYGREHNEWIPNIHGGHDNLEAIEFIKHMNSIIHNAHPGVLTIAEESTSFGGVSHPLERGGLGFDYKWNMGWMNDTLRYFNKDPIYRCYHHNDLTFGLIYAFSENFILVLSHDEVVHGKGNLISKMPGDLWQRFANLRLLYSYMICQPGKKLLFMGCEFAQWDEWHCKQPIQWDLLKFPLHNGVHLMVRDLNRLYLSNNAFWSHDHDYRGFEWIDYSDYNNSVISYMRKSSENIVVCVHNFTPNYFSRYFVRLPHVQELVEIFNSDNIEYGGANNINTSPQIHENGVEITLAPLATMIFRVKFK